MRRGRGITGVAAALAWAGALGAITTVAVAWASAAWLPHSALRRRHNFVDLPAPGPPEYVRVQEYFRPGMVRRAWNGVGAPGASPARAPDLGALEASSRFARRPSPRQDRRWGDLPRALAQPSAVAAGVGAEDARGWPFLALWCSLDEAVIVGGGGSAGGDPAPGGLAVGGRSAAPRTLANFRALPMRPITAGLAADMALYAGAWLAAFGGAGAVRVRLRRRCGACPRCAYDLRHDLSAGCPECGWRRGAVS